MNEFKKYFSTKKVGADMKKLYIVARNHMDPSWLRGFEDHFKNDNIGGIIRPYSDVEEMQILEYMDFAEKYGVKYHIEQSLPTRSPYLYLFLCPLT